VLPDGGMGATAVPAAKKKPKKCVVTVVLNGKRKTLYKIRYRVKTVHKAGGRKRQKLTRKRVKMKANCGSNCVRTKRVRGKDRVVRVRRRVRVFVKRHGRYVRTTRVRRVPKLVRCSASFPPSQSGTGIHIDVLPTSTATLDFGSFSRTALIQGRLDGFIPGTLDVTKPIDFQLTGGSIAIQPVGIFIDNSCNGQVSDAIRTSSRTVAVIDTSKTSSGTAETDGSVTSTVNTDINLSLELRNGDAGCNDPYITTGYTVNPVRLTFAGHLDFPTLSLKLTSIQKLIDFDACISPGAPDDLCNGFEIPFPILTTLKIDGTLGFG
jgi:hypothetical protein